jgi:SSS family solute:Na+ symporter
MTEEPDYNKIKGLTYGTTTDAEKRESRSSWSKIDVILSALVILLIIVSYLYFTG